MCQPLNLSIMAGSSWSAGRPSLGQKDTHGEYRISGLVGVVFFPSADETEGDSLISLLGPACGGAVFKLVDCSLSSWIGRSALLITHHLVDPAGGGSSCVLPLWGSMVHRLTEYIHTYSTLLCMCMLALPTHYKRPNSRRPPPLSRGEQPLTRR